MNTSTARGVLVIGGGIAGIQSALDLARAGFQVHLVERSPSVFPTVDCSI